MHTRGPPVICGGTASARFYKGGHVFALSASPSLPPLCLSLSLLLPSPRYLTQSLPPPLSCCLSLLWITCIMSAPVEQPTWLETKSPTSSQVSKYGHRPSARQPWPHLMQGPESKVPAKSLLPVPDLGDRGRSHAQCWLGSFAAQ